MEKYQNDCFTQEEISIVKPLFQEKAVQQFLFHFEKYKDNIGEFKFGDEIEYTLLSYNEKKKTVHASLSASTVLEKFKKKYSNGNPWCEFQHECVRCQVEGIPSKPFTEYDLLKWEKNMKLRRGILQLLLKNCEKAATLTVFPRMCCRGYTTLPPPAGTRPFSSDILDEIYCTSTDRYISLAETEKRIRHKHGSTSVPVYQDKYTKRLSCSLDSTVYTASLQVTIQAKNLDQARLLNDNFVVLTPFILSMSAATPIANGYLLATDTRWRIAGDFVHMPSSSNKPGYDRSRFGKVPDFLSMGSEKYNDLQYPMDKNIYNILILHGVENLLAKYYATMFTATPWYLARKDLQNDDSTDSVMFENAQSTSWGAIRLKLPLHENEGWRLEFRICEVQMTDFQNAAFTTFLVLFAKLACQYNLDLRMPVSKVEENIDVANNIDSVNAGKFWFPPKAPLIDEDVEELFSVDDVMNGKVGEFEGLIPMIKRHLESKECCYSKMDCEKILVYLDYLSDIAGGRQCTNAAWMRNFVTSHKDYGHDSVVTEELQFDLLKACDDFVKENYAL